LFISGSIAAAMYAENCGTKAPLERLKNDSPGQALFRNREMAKSKIIKVDKFLAEGPGGATHQSASSREQSLTTNQGVVVADNQNTLKSGERGPSLLEDFHFREKITHFDHERIPERIVHARGSGAHGYFEVTNPIPHLTKASFLAESGKRTELFARFSTVAGGAGAGETCRETCAVLR
jgi:hypothetical protein